MTQARSFRTTNHISGDLIIAARLAQDLIAHRLTPIGITYAQAVTLVRLWRRGGTIQQRELIESLALSRASGTLVLQELEEKGLVQRRPDEKDGRRYIVEVTPRGVAIEADVVEAFDEIEAVLVANVSADGLTVSQEVLRDVLAAARTARSSQREGS